VNSYQLFQLFRSALRTEYRILKELSPLIPGVIRALDLQLTSAIEFMVLEDYGGISLRPFYNKDHSHKMSMLSLI
jgi:hypothetical protein